MGRRGEGTYTYEKHDHKNCSVCFKSFHSLSFAAAVIISCISILLNALHRLHNLEITIEMERS